MPFVNIQLIAGRTDEQKQKIAAAVTHALAEHAKTNPDQTFVVFEDVTPNNWAVGGKLVSSG